MNMYTITHYSDSFKKLVIKSDFLQYTMNLFKVKFV